MAELRRSVDQVPKTYGQAETISLLSAPDTSLADATLKFFLRDENNRKSSVGTTD